MITERRSFYLRALLTIAIGFVTACDDGVSRNGGILVSSSDLVDIAGLKLFLAHPGVLVSGHDVGPIAGTSQFGTVTSFPQTTTDSNGQFFVVNGVLNAFWDSTVVWNQPCGIDVAKSARFTVTTEDPGIAWVCDFTQTLSSTEPGFVTSNVFPASLVVSHPGFSTQYGNPVLRTYLQGKGFVSASSATSVSPDGSSATFPFPTQANGTPLSTGLYAYNVWNGTSSGQLTHIGNGFFSIGSNDTSMTTPYGVEAVDISVSFTLCTSDGFDIWCNGPFLSADTPASLVTLSSIGQISFQGNRTAVGSQPTAIKAYATTTNSVITDVYGSQTNTTQPSRAIVANFGSNTVSVVDLFNLGVVQTISVGTQPAALVVKTDETRAYVANYGGSSISEINLTNNTQSRVAAVGAQPAALAMDPGGSALWVGGLNYISKVDLTSFSVVQTFSVSGQVTSIAVSSGQNSLVYTVVTTSPTSTTFQAQQASLTSGAFQASYAQYTIPTSSSYLAQNTTSGGTPAPPGWLMANGALVSANYGNTAAVVGTPTGFALIDLVNHVQVMQGNTPSPVRGIATNLGQGIAYITTPDSNSLISVPLPKSESHLSSQSLH